MPIFEYECTNCQTQFELLVRNGEKPRCEKCDSTKVEKLLSAPVSHVSGSSSLPVTGGSCPPSDAPPCHPNCCRL